ncbi:MAG: 1-deoxy-D-xylulose-5-phosphate reductoisomerase [Bacteroidales bacterium]|nr:1-deoxy-D-xylulose-5-phosphate reductoisomerase [Bacteroidales bacterium]
MKRRIAILGSTGSIGTQALEVVDSLPDLLEVEVLAAYSNADLLIQQAKKYKPNIVVIVREDLCDKVKSALWDDDIKVFAGEQSLVDVAAMDCVDMVLSAIVGVAGLRPAYHVIESGKPLALANKETLVVAGSLMTATAAAKGVNIYPVDSEHSAIFQCLAGEFHNPIEKLIITASGGPFRGKDAAFLKTVTREDALRHPNWNMGPKITIDSATMMNKGLEIIEASWLFNVPIDKIEVVVHPQSIIHSLVQFADGAVKAQLGLPDMKLPIQYALTYPARQPNNFPRFSFADYPQLTFEQPDHKTFPCISLACEAFRQGGNMPCVLNAANEVAVRSFLQGEIGFTDIPKHIEKCLSAIPYSKPASVDEFLQVDAEVRKIKCVNN